MSEHPDAVRCADDPVKLRRLQSTRGSNTLLASPGLDPSCYSNSRA
jgi:hypothetical protein